jgi:DNA-binding transcriptional LysR family regulator
MQLVPASLRYLEQVARSGSIQRAAKHLNVAASAIDRQILLLEADLGVPLFDRVPKGMRPTPAGETIVTLARRWLADVKRIDAEIQQMRGVQQGRVRLAAMDSHVNGLLPLLVDRLTREHPRIALEVEIGGTDQVIAWLLNREVDIAVAFNVARRREIHAVRTYHLPFGCVVAPEHPLASRASATFRDLVSFPIAYQSGSLAVRRILETRHRWLLETKEPPLATNSIQLIKRMVRNGRFAAFLTHLDAPGEISAGELKFLPIRDRDAEPETLTLAIDSQRSISSIGRIVLDAIIADLDRLAAPFNLKSV